MRAGTRFVRHSPPMRSAMWRSAAYSVPAAAPWALLPLVVRHQLELDAGWYGVILGLMGVGGVSAGMLLPKIRARASRGGIVLGSTLVSCAGIALLGMARHWSLALLGMLLFGLGWVSAFSTLMSSAQLVAPPWVRARALAIYQLSYNVTLAVFSFVWGWVGLHLSLSVTLYTAAGVGVLLAALARGFGIDEAAGLMTPVPQAQVTAPEPEAPAEELRASLPRSRSHVLEVLRYRVAPGDRAAFLAVMAEVRHVRGRTGAIDWQLFEDIAHPDSWLEAWVMQDWAEHLREAGRISPQDRDVLAAALAFQEDAERPASRYLAVDPEHRS